MLKLKWILVPITLDCNLSCRYCFRKKEKIEQVPEFSEEMIQYFKNLKPEECQSVAVTGGEPLLYFDKVKEFFSYIPDGILKRILSNGTLLTQEIVDYINENNIEFQTSHDGKITSYLRGVDVLRNPVTRDLIRQIKRVKVTCVVTKYNPDVWENFFDTVKLLQRTDIEYNASPVMDAVATPDLIEGFDFETWFRTWMEFQVGPFKHKAPRKGLSRPNGLNVLPDGTVCGCIKIGANYGSAIENTVEECSQKVIDVGDMDYCIKTGCKFKNTCRFMSQGMSDFLCTCRRMIMERCTPETKKELRPYVMEHMVEIANKYGYKLENIKDYNYGEH